jgi:hypothetical protein
MANDNRRLLLVGVFVLLGMLGLLFLALAGDLVAEGERHPADGGDLDAYQEQVKSF